MVLPQQPPTGMPPGEGAPGAGAPPGGAPQGPSPSPGLPLMDPTQLYETMLKIQAAIEAQAEQMLQPIYPPWYNPDDYPKPQPEQALAKVTNLAADFAPYRRRVLDDLRSARMETAGFFEQDKYEPDFTQWRDTGIMGEVELQTYELADCTISFDAKAPRRDLEDEAGRKIDFATACLDSAERRHIRMGNGPLRVEKARTLLLTGRLAWHCMLDIDPDEGDMPFRESLVDPTTCFPVYEGDRGMAIMGRQYMLTVGEAIAAFDTPDRELYKKHIASINKQRSVTMSNPKRREEEPCQVTEYWDRRWRVVWIDGDHLITHEHKYGFVPFVYVVGPIGMPAFMRDPFEGPTEIFGTHEHVYFHSRDVSQPHKGLGLPSLLKLPVRLREALMSRLLTAFTRSINPPIGIAMDDIAYDQGTPPIDRSRGAINPFKLGRHELVELTMQPDPNTLGPLLQGVADNTSRLSQPPTAHGLNDKSNVSGYATQGLNEAGRVKLVPWMRTLEEFEKACMEMRFRMFRDWGHLVKQGDQPYGHLTVPKSEATPWEDQMFELTPGDLKRAGLAIEVSLSNLPLQMLGQVLNAGGMGMQMGVMDEIDVMRLMGAQNPYKKLRRIQERKLMNDPAVLEAEMLQEYIRNGEMGMATYIAARKMNARLEDMLAAAAPPQPEGGGPGLMGESWAAMGQPPGPGSGPQGPVGPRTPTSPIGTEP